jgi:hypothetical protein
MPMEVGFLTQVPKKSDSQHSKEGWIVTGLIIKFCEIGHPRIGFIIFDKEDKNAKKKVVVCLQST